MIEKTTDYKKFKLLDWNREISAQAVRLLIRSISEENMLHLRPILVNKKMEVLDGQHRLKAAETMQIPIYYTIVHDVTPEMVIALNQNQKIWKWPDYLHFFASIGVKGAQEIKDHLEHNEYIVNSVHCLTGLTKKKDYNRENGINFELGLSRLKEWKRVEETLLDLGAPIGHIKNHVTANVLKAWSQVVFDAGLCEQFLKRLPTLWRRFINQGDLQSNIQNVKEIVWYHHQSKTIEKYYANRNQPDLTSNSFMS